MTNDINSFPKTNQTNLVQKEMANRIKTILVKLSGIKSMTIIIADCKILHDSYPATSNSTSNF